ncbi:MAG: bifunctional DNA-binding transcriptional regulator/O6-methylguanine-DNA methyltransferase Ada [Gemmatimonadota bacterium]
MPAVAATRIERSTGHDPRWDAVLARDSSFDGAFFTAVRTTKIYCRPSCPARHPKLENVSFFRTPDEAETAGYRACRRCHPRAVLVKSDDDIVRRVSAHVIAHLDERVTLEGIARTVGLSPFYLQRRFKHATGLTPGEFTRAKRTERLRSQLRAGETVSRATYGAGFGSSSRAYDQAAKRLGMTPGQYAKGGDGMMIRHTIVTAPVGHVLIGITDRGVAAVLLGTSAASLLRALRVEYPRAKHVPLEDPAAAQVTALIAQVVRAIADQTDATAIPLDLAGTVFQQTVWRALQKIPLGETRSYRAVARSIGRPSAARAVAGACAANKVAILVPCHRVVREDGAIGGYRWGAARKRALLAAEGAAKS